jgi:hypothetical protein
MSARPDALIEEAIETVNLSLGVNAPGNGVSTARGINCLIRICCHLVAD